MKKLTLMLFIAAMLNTPAAEAVFIPLSLQPGGPLHAGVPYTFRVGDAANGTAAMLQAVRGRLELEETLTVPSGNLVDLVFTIPSRANRVVLVLDLVEEHGEVTLTVLDQIGNTVISAKNLFVLYVYELGPSRRGGVRGCTLNEARYKICHLNCHGAHLLARRLRKKRPGRGVERASRRTEQPYSSRAAFTI